MDGQISIPHRKQYKTAGIQNKSYNIKKFGAKPESDAASNQHAINLAISACSNAGGGKVIVPGCMAYRCYRA